MTSHRNSVGLLLVARLGSKRYPRKVLASILGRSVLGNVIDRLRKVERRGPIVLCTSTSKLDDELAKVAKLEGIEVYRGDEHDVSNRLLSAASHYNFDYFCRVNADNVFVDWESINILLTLAEIGHYDFLTNTIGRTFGYGMSVEVVRTSKYFELLSSMRFEDKEHVTSHFYRLLGSIKHFSLVNEVYSAIREQRFALDTQEDLLRLTEFCLRSRKLPSEITKADLNGIILAEQSAGNAATGLKPIGERIPAARFIAEIGGNHEGDFDYALRLTDLALESEVDYIKFQVYQPDGFVSLKNDPDRYEHFKRFSLSLDQHEYLAKKVVNGGKKYMASIWNIEGFERLDPYCEIYKIGSGDMNNMPIIQRICESKKPIILSTGLSDLNEVCQVVNFIKNQDDFYKSPSNLCIMQCTSAYPNTNESVNASVINTYRDHFKTAVGYSHHTPDIEALELALCLGVDYIEFHFTDTKEGKSFRDHLISLTPQQIRSLKSYQTGVKTLLGDPTKMPTRKELASGNRSSFRRGVYFRRRLAAGDKIQPFDLETLRPATEVTPMMLDWYLGQTLTRDVERGDVLDPTHLTI